MATDDEGNPVRFTRAERRLLARFVQEPETTLSRDVLLDAVSGGGSDTNDRNIDFLINRLRRKLGDSPRNPRFIATQYGEGYVWIAGRLDVANDIGPVSVGPVIGLEDAGRFAETGQRFSNALERAIADETHDANPLRPAESGREGTLERPAFRIELCFLELEGQLDCAVTLRRVDTMSVVTIDRVTVGRSGATGDTFIGGLAGRLAASAVEHVWRVLAPNAAHPETPHELPPAVRLHDAAEQVVRPDRIWQENEKRLRATLANDPDDAVAKLMLATSLHAKYIQSGISILADSDPRAEDEAEIERLVTEALPVVQDNGIHALTAAKLLIFVSRAHVAVAMDLAARAFRFTTAFAAGCSLYGQLRMWHGDTDEALTLYDKALTLSERGSHFHLYILVLKCQALTAEGDHAAVAPLIKDVCGANPVSRGFFSLFYDLRNFAGGIDLTPEREAALAAMKPRQAGAVLTFLHYTCARLFVRQRHRRNIMATPAETIARRFGQDCIPAEARADITAHILP